MTEIAFYHLQRWPLERVLPKLLEKTMAAGKRALVVAGSVERIESLNSLLWTFDPGSWLPHASVKDGDGTDQPVWLSTTDDNLNGSKFLFLTDGAVSDRVGEFERCFELFDGRDSAALTAARIRWRTYKDAGHDLAYWQQTEAGGWEKTQ